MRTRRTRSRQDNLIQVDDDDGIRSVDGDDCNKPKRGTMICIVVEFYETMRPFAGLEFFSEDGWKESVWRTQKEMR